MNTSTLTATLTATVTRHDGSFVKAAWESWLGASTLACQVTATAWTWYIEAFFGQSAMRRYQWLGQMLRCLALLTYWSGVYCGSKAAAYVERCQRSQEPEPVASELYPISVLPLENSRVHEAEPPTEKNESNLTICTLQDKPYQELKALAKSLGHPKPHMTKKADLIDWIQSSRA